MSGPISQAEYKVDERCPMCECTDVEGDSIDINNGHAYQEITCTCCGANWKDVYVLRSYESLFDGDGKEVEAPLYFPPGACG